MSLDNGMFKGLLINTVIICSLLISGCGNVNEKDASKVEKNKGENKTFQECAKIVNKLKKETKSLDQAIKDGHLTLGMYGNVKNSLVDLEDLKTFESNSEEKNSMLNVVDYTDEVVKLPINNTSKEILEEKAESLVALDSVQNKLGVSTEKRRIAPLAVKTDSNTDSNLKYVDDNGNPCKPKTEEEYKEEVEKALKEVVAKGGSWVAVPRQCREVISNAPK